MYTAAVAIAVAAVLVAGATGCTGTDGPTTTGTVPEGEMSTTTTSSTTTTPPTSSTSRRPAPTVPEPTPPVAQVEVTG